MEKLFTDVTQCVCVVVGDEQRGAFGWRAVGLVRLKIDCLEFILYNVKLFFVIR